MREIIFRGKLVDNGHWVYGGFTLDAIDNPRITEKDGRGGLIFHPVIPETVGQYTGLNDMNGSRIFEGDIVEYKTLHLLVSFNEEHGCFTVDDNYWMNAHAEFEIIGNIHDNPELLEDK